MISFWVMVFFLIGDSACSSSEMTAKEGSCVTVHVTLSDTKHSEYIVWLKDAVWNKEGKEFEGTIVHSLKPDKHNASEFENRVSVCSTGDLYELTIRNLRLNDSGKYMVRYYGKADPSYKLSSSTMSLNVQENPCQVSVTGPELVQAGAEVILRCSTVGPCEYSPEWRSSGPGPASSEVIDTQGAKTAQLRFEADWSHDGVMFSCWPSLSNDTCASRNITLAVGDAPKGVRITASGTLEGIYEGAAVSLTCEVQSSNPSVRSYSWYKDRTVLRKTGPVLHFLAVRLEDRGSYRCQASNSVGSGDSPEVTITVNYGPRGTKITASCCQGRVKAGESLTLTCETDARPEPYGYTWFRTITEPGGQRGPGRTEVPVSSNGRSDGRYLRFWQISAGDAGEYMCQAKNIVSAEKSTALRVDVLYEPTGLNLSMDSEVRESSLVTIHCSVESFPPSELTLAWDPPSSNRLSDLSRYPKRLQRKSTVQSTRTSLAASFPASVKHAGRYTCRASNSEGWDETAKELVVYYGPRGTKIKASCCQGGVKAGEGLTLTCETNARPEPYGYTWFRVITEPGGQRGPGRTEVAVSSNRWSDGQYLRFWQISAGDAGEYTCQAKNTISAQNSTALRVDVLYGPTGLTLSMDREAREYSLVTIQCSVESFPLSELTLTWAPPSPDRLSYLSRHPKRLQGNYTDQPTRTSLATSFIASVEHAGWYTCRASNSEGQDETTKELVVHYAPKDVRATANPRGEVTEKTDLDLSCEARSNPGVAAYAWFKLTGRGAEEVGQGPVLTLTNLSEAHTGQYLCRTRNNIGEGNSSVIDVTVRYGPRKPVVIHNMTSRGQPVKGSAVALMCSSQSYPPIRSYKWHIQKDVNVETLLRPGKNLTIGSDEEGIYYCSAENEISNSSSDPIEIRFDRFDIASLLIGAGASAGAMMMICLIMQLILKKKRHSQRSGSRMKDSEGIILSDVTAAQDEESIYANKTMLSGAGAVEKGDEGALHYATVDFSKRPGTGGEHGTGIVQGTSKRTSDYTVIRHKSREEREGGEEEGEGAKEEVEKEGQAELGTEREWAEATGEKEEETTYGNICPSRPTKRARQGLQQLPRNPAAEEEQEEQRQEENSAGGQEYMYVEAMSPLMEGNRKGTEECEYAVVRKPK